MGFTKLAFLKTWLSDKDFPTVEESETQIRQDFQYHPDAIMQYLNEVLLTELEGAEAAKALGTEDGRSIQVYLDELDKYAKEEVEKLNEIVHTLVSGGTPDAWTASKVVFTAEEWVQEGDGHVLRIPKEQHNREHDAFVHSIRPGNWYALCTSVIYDEETEVIALGSEEPYSGEIVFYGL